MAATGIPHESQMDKFISDLEDKLQLQVENVHLKKHFPENIKDEISRHSWEAMSARINTVITGPA